MCGDYSKLSASVTASKPQRPYFSTVLKYLSGLQSDDVQTAVIWVEIPLRLACG
jgi:hypothetical protein